MADHPLPLTPPDSHRAVPEPDVLTVPEAAELLRLSQHGLRNMLARGEVPGAVRFGRCWRISRRALEHAVHGDPGNGPR